LRFRSVGVHRSDIAATWPHNSAAIIDINVEYDHLKVQSVRVGQALTSCSDSYQECTLKHTISKTTDLSQGSFVAISL
jgi:hypothetical protein